MNSLRNRLSLALSLVLLAAAALLALGLQDFPRRLVEDFVGSRLRHDADLLYARVLDEPPGEILQSESEDAGRGEQHQRQRQREPVAQRLHGRPMKT